MTAPRPRPAAAAPRRPVVVALVPAVAALLALTACGQDAAPDRDGAAVAACRAALSPLDELATTVRDEGDGWVVDAWVGSTPAGDPDHVCRVAPDGDRRVRVVDVAPRPPGG